MEIHDTVAVECAERGVQESEVFTSKNVYVVPNLPDLSSSVPSQNDVDGNPHLAWIEIPDIRIIDEERAELAMRSTCGFDNGHFRIQIP